MRFKIRTVWCSTLQWLTCSLTMATWGSTWQSRRQGTRWIRNQIQKNLLLVPLLSKHRTLFCVIYQSGHWFPVLNMCYVWQTPKKSFFYIFIFSKFNLKSPRHTLTTRRYPIIAMFLAVEEWHVLFELCITVTRDNNWHKTIYDGKGHTGSGPVFLVRFCSVLFFG